MNNSPSEISNGARAVKL